jgi:hypothetical protein
MSCATSKRRNTSDDREWDREIKRMIRSGKAQRSARRGPEAVNVELHQLAIYLFIIRSLEDSDAVSYVRR